MRGGFIPIIMMPVFCVCSALATNDQTKTATATSVQLEVINGCLLNNNSANAILGTLDFGQVYNLNALKDAVSTSGNGTIELRCTPGTTAKITLNAGLYGANISNRKMKLTTGTATLNYQLYTAAARTTVWDDTIGISVNFANDSSVSFPIYARIPVQTTPQSGQYSDQVTVTITY